MASFDGIQKTTPRIKIAVKVTPIEHFGPLVVSKIVTEPKRNYKPTMLAGGFAIVMVSFFAGAFTVWNTHNTQADQLVSPGGLVTRMEFNQDDLNVVADFSSLLQENRHVPTAEEVANQERREKLKNYLAGKRSPLAKDEKALDALLASNNLEMMLAISFVEGNFCQHHYHHNCSGIGGSNIVKYKNFAEWIKSFDSLLERRYKGFSVEEFKGVYVQPGSRNWVNGVKQILAELKEQGIN